MIIKLPVYDDNDIPVYNIYFVELIFSINIDKINIPTKNFKKSTLLTTI